MKRGKASLHAPSSGKNVILNIMLENINFIVKIWSKKNKDYKACLSIYYAAN